MNRPMQPKKKPLFKARQDKSPVLIHMDWWKETTPLSNHDVKICLFHCTGWKLRAAAVHRAPHLLGRCTKWYHCWWMKFQIIVHLLHSSCLGSRASSCLSPACEQQSSSGPAAASVQRSSQAALTTTSCRGKWTNNWPWLLCYSFTLST